MTATRYAFFDVDETLIGLKSMFSFRDFYLRWQFGPEEGATAQRKAAAQIKDQVAQGLDRTEVNRLFWEGFRGAQQADMRRAAEIWHSQVRTQPGYFIGPTLAALRQHQSEGVEPVFVSGSCTEILEPLAVELGVKYLLVNHLEVERGQFTGKLVPPQTIGTGKREAIIRFLDESDTAPADCYGYGDHLSDLPLLECVGHPTVVDGNAELMAIARHRGWPVLTAHALA